MKNENTQRTPCPRCGDMTLEVFSTHDYCWSCNYSSEYDEEETPIIPNWVWEAIEEKKPVNKTN